MTLRSALLAAALLCSLGCSIHIGESFFLRPASRHWSAAAVDASFQRTQVTVTHRDGNVSQGIRLFSPKARTTVLFFLGNNDSLDREGAIRLWQFERHGVNAYIFDRRGWGRTGGIATVALLGSDALDLFDHVRAASSGLLVVHGHSMGTGAVAHIVKHRAVDAAVVEGGAPSIPDYVRVHTPWYARLFARIRLADELKPMDIGQLLRPYQGPLLIAVGEFDQDTVPSLAQRLFEIVESPRKELAVVPNAEHRALVTLAGYEVYERFLRKLEPPA